MAKREMPPTKSNSIALKRDLEFAREGFDLLDEKRQILVLELMRHMERAKRLQQETDAALAEAFAAVRAAVLAVGRRALATLSEATPLSTEITVESRRLMGIDLPTVRFRAAKMIPRYGLAESSAHCDELHALFLRLMPKLAELAEIENTVVRLARELKKTQRRVNALERIFIPDTRDTIKFITDTLEEREREAMGIMRMVKHRTQKDSAGDRPDTLPAAAKEESHG